MLENYEKGYVKAIKKKRKKLPTLKGKSKIKEGECLLSLGKIKKVSQQMSKVDKKNMGYKHDFWHP
jgi:hypothetical protein